MTNKETKVMFANAVRAMKALGISEDKVKPVLNDLLKLFDNNWDYIEEENYRVLVDTVFDRAESEAVKRSKKKNVKSEAADHSKKIVHNENKEYMDEETQATEEELDRPKRRLRRKYQDGQGSYLNAPDSSVPEMPFTTPKEAQAADHSKKILHNEEYMDEETQAAEEFDQPLRRMRRKYRDGQGSSSNASESSDPKMLRITPKEAQADDLPKKIVKNELAEEEIDQPLRRLRRKYRDSQGSSFNAPESSVPEMPIITPQEAEADDLSKKIVKNEYKYYMDEEDQTVKEVLYEPLRLRRQYQVGQRSSFYASESSVPKMTPITPKEEPNELHNGGNSLSRSGTVTEHECSASNEPRTNTELPVVTGQGSDLEIASLLFGEVKISMSCDLVLGRPDFRIPSCEAVVRLLEEKCLRSYKILDPRFSVMNLVKDMCQGFMELGSDSSSEPAAAINMTQGFNLLNKLSATGSCVGGSHLKVMDCGDELPEKNLEREQHCAEDMNPSLMVDEQLNVTPETIKSMQDVFDIANGQENVVITLVNEFNNERPPPFYYLPKSAVYQNAHVNFTLARIGKKNCCPTCSKDCLSSFEPCACAHESGGAFAYTPGGLVKEDFLKECISINRNPKEHSQFFCNVCPRERAKGADDFEPCKGHTMRKFIKECWWKCGCGLRCGNRVVQRGISCNLQVFMTGEGKGWGLRTMVDLPKGAFVCEYVGEILTNSELYDRVLRCRKGEKHSYPVVLDADWGGVLEDEKALCLDAAYYGNVGRFINHRCYDSNLVDIPVEVETPDHHYYHLAFFTTRKVNAMEELTWDYGIDFDDRDQPFKLFRCQCGSKFCRNMKRLRS